MTIYKELSFENEVRNVEGIQFSVMSADDIVKNSVAEITSTDTYSGNEPIIGGLFDSRMGVIENDRVCKTCMQKNTFCPGHFGHINLAKPVFHMQFFDIVRKILKCVCFRCSTLLIDPNDPEIQKVLNKKNLSRQKKFDFLYKACQKVKRCGNHNPNGCGAKLPSKVSKENIGVIIMDWTGVDDLPKDLSDSENKVTRTYVAEDVLNILKRITDEDASVLGFPKEMNRPESLICTVFPVPPPTVRPSVKNDTGQRCEDDLTHKLCDIIKTNKTLHDKIKNSSEDRSPVIDQFMNLLQYHITTFVDNSIPNVPPAKQRTGRPLRSVTERLKSKEGRIRGNLMGKRVDFSARSVITPDPNISIDEVGVPLKVAMNLTFPEVVNDFNKTKLESYIDNGPNVYPGAKYIKQASKNYRTIRINNENKMKPEIINGDIVERHLIDGDYVLFNRQPSLHKMSMMAHKVKVMEYDTFRLNVCCTPSYNADYDGDEMNLHVPQSLQTENELIELASVPTQIMSPKDSSPIISVVQDISLGIYKITHKDTFITDKQAMNLIANNTRFNGNIPENESDDKNKWMGRTVMSTVFPPTLNTQIDDLHIKNGIIGKDVKGVLSKKAYQSMTNGIVHAINNDLGQNEIKSVFDNTQRMICDWLVYNGFSVGVSDLIVKDKTKQKIKDSNKFKEEYEKIKKQIYNQSYTNNTVGDNIDFIEGMITKAINENYQEICKAVKDDKNVNDVNNRMLNMVNAKSKGNDVNIIQMMGVVGPQSVEGKRIGYGFDDRTLPHYHRYDDGPEARGYIQSSFIDGLTPQEFFFHAMAGREGLIDTAVKTSETGYIQRRLVKAMEDCKVHHDMTVRNANNQVVQFIYGDDAIDACKLEKQYLSYLKSNYSINELKNDFLIEGVKSLKPYINNEVFKEMNQHATKKKLNEQLVDYFNQIIEDREFVISKILHYKDEHTILYAIAFDRLIKNTVCLYSLDQRKSVQTDLSLSYIFDKIEMLSKLTVSNSTEGNKILQILLRYYINPKEIIIRKSFTKEAFDYLCDLIKERFYKSLVTPSELVGVVSAQSIGEPTTQLTLNTFHLSGVASASKATRGVPRIKELLSISKNIKSPQLKIFLKPKYKTEDQVNKIKHEIQIIKLVDFIKEIKITYDTNNILSEYNSYSSMTNDITDNTSLTWKLIITLNGEKMLGKIIDADLQRAFLSTYTNVSMHIIPDKNKNNNNFEKSCVVMIKNPSSSQDMLTDLKAIEHEIMNLTIKGINGINNITPDKEDEIRHINPKTLKVECEIECKINEKEVNYQENKKQGYYLITEGTNLLDVLCLHKFVDQVNTISNDVYEIYNVLGVEAARFTLYNEISEIFRESGGVNPRHISLLVDIMTSRGTLLSIDRHGINRSDIGTLAKCSFEETADVLIKSGVFGEYDNMNGVAASVITGQLPKSGTGDNEVLMDFDSMIDIKPNNLESIDEIDECSELEKLEFNFHI